MKKNSRRSTPVNLYQLFGVVSELDNVIAGLGEIRAAMVEQVSAEPKRTAGMRELMVADPAWRTERPVHSDLAYISFASPRSLCTRHVAFRKFSEAERHREVIIAFD
jgi:hypothetical protein